MATISPQDLQDMVSHWLNTPLNGYLGSDYGQTVTDMLLTPMRTGLADDVLNKLRRDVPLIGQLPRGAVNMFSVDEGPDIRRIYIEVSGTLIDAGTTT